VRVYTLTACPHVPVLRLGDTSPVPRRRQVRPQSHLGASRVQLHVVDEEALQRTGANCGDRMPSRETPQGRCTLSSRDTKWLP
jgi:hypothetical protein